MKIKMKVNVGDIVVYDSYDYGSNVFAKVERVIDVLESVYEPLSYTAYTVRRLNTEVGKVNTDEIKDIDVKEVYMPEPAGRWIDLIKEYVKENAFGFQMSIRTGEIFNVIIKDILLIEEDRFIFNDEGVEVCVKENEIKRIL